ncbi:hypothetical protein [Oceanobacillus zhaokaii]|uniref:hypothetical protein n=1 Tax=Oceanobacillus zhaokaii TaxID=2052660 RepID=UPI001FA8BDD0|nr:hypothetical protein [Oceanobacillus zhaokaii]
MSLLIQKLLIQKTARLLPQRNGCVNAYNSLSIPFTWSTPERYIITVLPVDYTQ